MSDDGAASEAEGVYVHPSACVDDLADIGAGTRVWHFCHVMRGARVGRGCVLGQNVFVAAGAVVGDRTRIQNNVSVYDGVILEEDVFLGPSCVLTNVKNPRVEVPRHGRFETTRVGRGATIGANATLVCGHTIGRFAFVGAGAVVTRDVPAYALMLGTPARQVGWVGRHGERLTASGPADWTCPVSGLRYREEGGVLRCPDLAEDAPLRA